MVKLFDLSSYETEEELAKKIIKETRMYTELCGCLQPRCEVLSDIPEQLDFIDEMPEYDVELYRNKKQKTTPESAAEALGVLLPLLEGDLLHIMQACTDGTLAQQEVKFSDGAAACVILASGGYPVAYEKGKPISGLVDGQLPGEENVTVYHSGTAITEDGQLVTNGGRVLGVTATGPRI